MNALTPRVRMEDMHRHQEGADSHSLPARAKNQGVREEKTEWRGRARTEISEVSA